MITSILYMVIGFIEVLVGLRFVFRLLGANPASSFVNWVYDWSTPLVAPFAGIFGQSATVAGTGVATQSVFDWTALIALVVYGLIAAAISRFAMNRPYYTR
jgi:hypothetical protein